MLKEEFLERIELRLAMCIQEKMPLRGVRYPLGNNNKKQQQECRAYILFLHVTPFIVKDAISNHIAHASCPCFIGVASHIYALYLD